MVGNTTHAWCRVGAGVVGRMDASLRLGPVALGVAFESTSTVPAGAARVAIEFPLVSAPTYLEGIKRAKRVAPNRAALTLLLWGFLAVMFILLAGIFMRAGTTSHAPVVAAPPPDASPLLTLLDSPWSLPLVLLGAAVVAYQLLLRAQRRAMVPLREARLATARGDSTRAVSVLRDALGGRRGPGIRAALLHALAQVASERGDFVEALDVLDETDATLGPAAQKSDRETNDFRVNVRMARAEALLALGRHDEAEAQLTPLPAAWMPLAHAWGTALSIRLAAARRDHATTLRLLREHAVANERRLTLRERWLLRAVEHLVRHGHVPVDALPADPTLRAWIAARLPGSDLATQAAGGAA